MEQGVSKGLDLSKDFPYVKQGTAHVLAIGINRFVSFHPLFNAKKDVQDILNVLTQKYQFKDENITRLFDKKATKNNIINELIRFKNDLEEEDSLLILFSGHGAIDKSDPEIGYWIPYDAKRNEVGDYLENFQIKKRLEGIKARHVLIIADSCYSGEMFKGSNEEDDDDRRNQILSGIPSRWFLASGRGKVRDGPPGGNSPFARALLEILGENEKETLRISTVIESVLNRVDLKYKQIPKGERLDMEGHEGGQFVFFNGGDPIPPPPPPPWLIVFFVKMLVFVLLFSIIGVGGFSLWKLSNRSADVPSPIVEETVTFVLSAEISDSMEVRNIRLDFDTTLKVDPTGRTVFTPPEDWIFNSDSLRIFWEENEEDENTLKILDTLIIVKTN